MPAATALPPAPPAPHLQQLDHIEHLIEDLSIAINNLIQASWGSADDGTTSIPLPDGTASELSKRLKNLATEALAICEYRKDLAQPGEF